MKNFGLAWLVFYNFLSFWKMSYVYLLVAVCRYQQCLHQRMHHIQPDSYDELVQIVVNAQKAHCLVPGGMLQFQELLQTLRRNKACKKDLWHRISQALQPSWWWRPPTFPGIVNTAWFATVLDSCDCHQFCQLQWNVCTKRNSPCCIYNQLLTWNCKKKPYQQMAEMLPYHV